MYHFNPYAQNQFEITSGTRKKKKKSNFKVLKGLIFSFQISLSKNLSERDLKTFYNNNLNNRFSVGSFVSATWMNMLMLCKCFTYTACGQL